MDGTGDSRIWYIGGYSGDTGWLTAGTAVAPKTKANAKMEASISFMPICDHARKGLSGKIEK